MKTFLILLLLVGGFGCKPRTSSVTKDSNEDFLRDLENQIDQATTHAKSFAQQAFDPDKANEILTAAAQDQEGQTGLFANGPQKKPGAGEQSGEQSPVQTTEKWKKDLNTLRGRIVDLEVEITDKTNKGLKDQAERLEIEKVAITSAIVAINAIIDAHAVQINQNAQANQENRDRINALEAKITLLTATIERLANASNPAGQQTIQGQGGGQKPAVPAPAVPRIACGKFSGDQAVCTGKTNNQCAFISTNTYGGTACVDRLATCATFANDTNACNQQTVNRCAFASTNTYGGTACLDRMAKCAEFTNDANACNRVTVDRCTFISTNTYGGTACIEKAAACASFTNDTNACNKQTGDRCVFIRTNTYGGTACVGKSLGCEVFTSDQDACNKATLGRCVFTQINTYTAGCVSLTK